MSKRTNRLQREQAERFEGVLQVKHLRPAYWRDV
jgi:hypothetical protein